MTLTNYAVINKTKYEVYISLKNHPVKSWHHHNTLLTFSSFMMENFSLRLIARITSSVQASFILQYVLSLGTKSQISLKILDITDV